MIIILIFQDRISSDLTFNPPHASNLSHEGLHKSLTTLEPQAGIKPRPTLEVLVLILVSVHRVHSHLNRLGW